MNDKAVELITDNFKVIATGMVVFALETYCDRKKPSWVISRADFLDQTLPNEIILVVNGYIHAGDKVRSIEAYCNFYSEGEKSGFEPYMLTLYIGLERIVLNYKFNEKECMYEVISIESESRREMMRIK